MADASVPDPLTDIHVADWTVVHVRQDLDVDTVRELRAHLAPLLTRHARIAVDLRRCDVSPEAAVAVLGLVDDAVTSGARLVVVEPREHGRDVLRAAGVPHVHESLDDAVHDLAPANAVRTPVLPELAPAATDAILVATEDVSGQHPGPAPS